MTVTLELDDRCCPFTGHNAAEAMLMAVKQDPEFFMKAADSISIKCLYGVASEER